MRLEVCHLVHGFTKIAFNETNKYFRRNKVQVLSLEIDQVDRVMVCGVIPEADKKLAVLKQLIKELNDQEVKTLELKYFENKNFSEIAFILGEKESTVKMRLYRALDKLKLKFNSMLNSDS